MMPDRLQLAAAGSWTAAHSQSLERLVDEAGREAAKSENVAIDMAGIEELDTLGAWLLERLARGLKASGKETALTGLKPRYRGLTDAMQRVNLQPRTAADRRCRPLAVLDACVRASLGEVLFPRQALPCGHGRAKLRVL